MGYPENRGSAPRTSAPAPRGAASDVGGATPVFGDQPLSAANAVSGGLAQRGAVLPLFQLIADQATLRVLADEIGAILVRGGLGKDREPLERARAAILVALAPANDQTPAICPSCGRRFWSFGRRLCRRCQP